MKNIILSLVITAITLGFVSCSDEDYTSKYLDPSKVTSVTIPGLMNGTFKRILDPYSMYGYVRYFATEPLLIGKLGQTFGYTYSSSMYAAGTDWGISGLFNNTYTSATQYIKLLDMYNNEISDADRKDMEAFKLAAEVHLFDFVLSQVDMYGDMPWTDAMRLPIEKDMAVASPAYDKAEDIYSMMLDQLKVCAERFTSSDLVQYVSFSSQDFVCNGSFDAWARYANSVRLRYALHISEYGPLTDKGKQIIAEILGNPSKYPVVEDNSQNIFLRNDKSGDLNFRPGGFDWTSCRQMSGSILDRMLSKGNFRSEGTGENRKWIEGTGTFTEGVDDPRAVLLCSMRGMAENKNGKVANYGGVQDFTYVNVLLGGVVTGDANSAFDPGKPVTLVLVGTDPGSTFRSVNIYDDAGVSEIVDGGFFRNNYNFEHVQITAAEVYFIKAEAYHKGLGVAKDEAKAEEYFKEAVKQSIKLYYHWNEVSDVGKTSAIPTPSDAAIEAFAAARWETSVNPAYPYSTADPKSDAILTQKWLNFGYLNSRECWAQLRRTGLPKLVYPASGSPSIPWCPDRLKYPMSEMNYNASYPGIDKDNYIGQLLFWANPKGMRHSTLNGDTWTDNWGD